MKAKTLSIFKLIEILATNFYSWFEQRLIYILIFQIRIFQKQDSSEENPLRVTKIAVIRIAVVRVGGDKTASSHQTYPIRIRVQKTTSSAFASIARAGLPTKMVLPHQRHLGLLTKCLSCGPRCSLQYFTCYKLQKTFLERYYYGVCCIVSGQCIASFLKFEPILSKVSRYYALCDPRSERDWW